jgi:vacuolar protein sorting-associated protein 41
MSSPSQPIIPPLHSSQVERYDEAGAEPMAGSDNGEEEEEEEEDDEEEEPQLKYERIGGDIAKVVRSDLVSAFAVGIKYIVPRSESKLI